VGAGLGFGHVAVDRFLTCSTRHLAAAPADWAAASPRAAEKAMAAHTRRWLPTRLRDPALPYRLCQMVVPLVRGFAQRACIRGNRSDSSHIRLIDKPAIAGHRTPLERLRVYSPACAEAGRDPSCGEVALTFGDEPPARTVWLRMTRRGSPGLALDRTLQVVGLSTVASLTRLVSGSRLGALRSLAVSPRRCRIGLATDWRLGKDTKGVGQ
jgi:hypothetical protein